MVSVVLFILNINNLRLLYTKVMHCFFHHQYKTNFIKDMMAGNTESVMNFIMSVYI